jgi:hypothetical protein
MHTRTQYVGELVGKSCGMSHSGGVKSLRRQQLLQQPCQRRCWRWIISLNIHIASLKTEVSSAVVLWIFVYLERDLSTYSSIYLFFGLWGYWHCGHSWPIAPASGDSEDDCGEVDGNVDWQGRPKFSEKPCPSATFVHHKIPHEKTRVWTRTAAVGSRRLTAWTMARPHIPVASELSYPAVWALHKMRCICS